MKNILFNPIYNKYPKGAVKNNQQVTFDIFINHSFYVQSISIVVINDFTKEQFSKALSIVSTDTDYVKYQVQLEALDSGLYFYYFDFHFSDTSLHLKNNHLQGELVPTTEESLPLFQLTVYDASFTTPEWYKGSIMYQIFPDRFKKSTRFIPSIAKNEEERYIHDNWYGTPHSAITHENYQAKDFFMGNLAGIEEEKHYFQDLNIDSIYLNPIVESAENHRYSTADYFNVDPYFGTNADFQQFCEEFKQENIRIILDGVFSHTGADSIYFNRYNHYDSMGAYNSRDSHYYSWFMFQEYPHSYHSWWGFDNLPTVDKRNKDYLEFITQNNIGVLNFWQQLGISGWRLDVADEFTDEFLDAIRASVKHYQKDALIIGEVWEDASNKISYDIRRRYFLGKQLDSVMNYPWREAIIQFMKEKDAAKFAHAILTLVEHYPEPALHSLMNLLSSHDTERILTVLAFDNPEAIAVSDRPNYQLSSAQYEKAKELLTFASFIQFTLPGVPCIYYGDEIGMYGFRDPYNRLGFAWENIDHNLLDFYKKLSAFRHQHQDSFRSHFELVYSQNSCIAYIRNDILCIVNLAKIPVLLPDYTGTQLFGNKTAYSTPLGLAIDAQSFVAVQLQKGGIQHEEK